MGLSLTFYNVTFTGYTLVIISYSGLEIYFNASQKASIDTCKSLVESNLGYIVEIRTDIQQLLITSQLSELKYKRSELAAVRSILLKFMYNVNSGNMYMNVTLSSEILEIVHEYYSFLLIVGK